MNLQKGVIRKWSDRMLIIKMIIYSSIFLTCSIIGILKSRKYVYRVNELREFKNALNIFKSKVTLHMNQFQKYLTRYQKVVILI